MWRAQRVSGRAEGGRSRGLVLAHANKLMLLPPAATENVKIGTLLLQREWQRRKEPTTSKRNNTKKKKNYIESTENALPCERKWNLSVCALAPQRLRLMWTWGFSVARRRTGINDGYAHTIHTPFASHMLFYSDGCGDGVLAERNERRVFVLQ